LTRVRQSILKYNFPFGEFGLDDRGIDLPLLYFLDDRPILFDSMNGFDRHSQRQMTQTKVAYLIEKFSEDGTTDLIFKIFDYLESLFVEDVIIVFKKRLGKSTIPLSVQCKLLELSPMQFIQLISKMVFDTKVYSRLT
jgi:hypothetical protein